MIICHRLLFKIPGPAGAHPPRLFGTPPPGLGGGAAAPRRLFLRVSDNIWPKNLGFHYRGVVALPTPPPEGRGPKSKKKPDLPLLSKADHEKKEKIIFDVGPWTLCLQTKQKRLEFLKGLNWVVVKS